MVPGVLFQVPSGLSNGGLLNFGTSTTTSTGTTYSAGFAVALQLVQVAIGLTVGLFVAVSTKSSLFLLVRLLIVNSFLQAAAIHPFQSHRPGAGLFSF